MAYSYTFHSPGSETLQNIGSSGSVSEGTVIADRLKRLGGDGVVTPTENMDQTSVGIYWAYEGTPVLGAAAAALEPGRRPSRLTEWNERRNPDTSLHNKVARMSK